VIELARARGFEVIERHITPDETSDLLGSVHHRIAG